MFIYWYIPIEETSSNAFPPNMLDICQTFCDDNAVELVDRMGDSTLSSTAAIVVATRTG